MTTADLWGLTLMVAGGLFAWWLANRMAEAPDRAFLGRVVAWSLGLRAAFSVFEHVIYPPAWKMFASDARARYAIAVDNVGLWRLGLWSPELPQTLSEAHEQLIRLVTTVSIYAFGPSPMVAEALPITLTTTAIIAIYLICRHIGATRSATRTAVLLAALLPSLIFWSTQIIKDPITATCVVWSVLAMFKVGQRAHGGYLLLLVIVDLIAIVYRPYVGILLVVGQGLAWAATVKLPPTQVGRIARVGIFATMAPVVIYLGVQEMQNTYGEGLNLEWAVEQYGVFRESGQELGGVKGSEYAIPLTASTPTQAILQLPLRILLLLLSPIPLFPGTLRRLMSYPEMWFLYIWVVPRFVAGFREAWRKNRPALLTILVTVLPLIVSYALKTAVSGEAIRMRIQFMPLLLIFAGIGHAVYQRRLAERRAANRHQTPAERYVEAQSETEQHVGEVR